MCYSPGWAGVRPAPRKGAGGGYAVFKVRAVRLAAILLSLWLALGAAGRAGGTYYRAPVRGRPGGTPGGLPSRRASGPGVLIYHRYPQRGYSPSGAENPSFQILHDRNNFINIRKIMHICMIFVYICI